jgi:hypothetical protein
MMMREHEVTARGMIERIAEIAHAVSQQAGVGGMETAGAIVSYLAMHPDDIEPFLNGGFLELPSQLLEKGCLSWHAMNGKIVTPRQSRFGRIIAAMKEPRHD